MEEITETIQSLNPNKATGPNSIPTKILQQTVGILAEPLKNLINLSFSNGVFPETTLN